VRGGETTRWGVGLVGAVGWQAHVGVLFMDIKEGLVTSWLLGLDLMFGLGLGLLLTIGSPKLLWCIFYTPVVTSVFNKSCYVCVHTNLINLSMFIYSI